MANSQSIQETYDKFSSTYDLFLRPFLESGRANAIEHLSPAADAKVLEVGIGTGLSLDYYSDDISLTAFDFSLGMLKESKKKTESCDDYCKTDLLQMDVQSMAFADNSFDYILSAYVLTVVEDTAKAVKEIFRVAKPGAKIVLINHLRSNSSILGAIEDLFHPIFSGLGLFTLDRDLVEILRDAGAQNIKIEPSNFLRLHHIISFNTPLK
ncbi:MAG: class I SAM-dependent methyltransferase [Candidatus Rifleibacteriota bacterium]